MEVCLDFEECTQDSPVFRLTLELAEQEVSHLESQVEKVMKLCSKMVEAGKSYTAANQLFLSGLTEFSTFHGKDSSVANCVNHLNRALQETLNFHTMLFDQTQRAVNQQLTSLFTQFLPQLGEIRREFVRIGEDLEAAALKSAQVSRLKSPDAERASHLLLATRKCYQHFALDYCLQLNNFKIQQKVDILNSVFSYYHAQYTFFHQGFDLLKDLEPTMKTMATQLSQLSAECGVQRKDLENRHLLVQQRIGDRDGVLDVKDEPSEATCSGPQWREQNTCQQTNDPFSKYYCASDNSDEDVEDYLSPDPGLDREGILSDSSSSPQISKHWSFNESYQSTDSVSDTMADARDPISNLNNVNGEGVVISGYAKKSNGHRLYKRHYCFYCLKPQQKMARHLEKKHSEMPEVSKACSFPKGSKERKTLLDYIRNKGNFKHNAAVLESGKGELVPAKKPPHARTAEDFIHCAYCMGLFSRKHLWQHLKKCKFIAASVISEPDGPEAQALCTPTKCMEESILSVCSNSQLDEHNTGAPEEAHEQSKDLEPKYSKDSNTDSEGDYDPEQGGESEGSKSDSGASPHTSKHWSLNESYESTDSAWHHTTPKALEAGTTYSVFDTTGEGRDPISNRNNVDGEGVVIGGYTRKSIGNRLYKRHYCFYCLKPQKKIARHLARTHSEMPEVSKACSLPKGSKERRALLQYICKKGNYKHNASVLESGKGELVPAKKPFETGKAEDFMHCAYCRGLFMSKHLWRHLKTCNRVPKCISKEPGRGDAQSLCAFTSPFPAHITRNIQKIIKSMTQDDITDVIKKDCVIMQFGGHMLHKRGTSARIQAFVHRKMRDMGRLLISARKVTSFRSMEELIDPQKYTEMIKAVKLACGYNDKMQKYRTQSLVGKLETILSTIGKLVKAKALIRNESDLVEKATGFQTVHKQRWKELVHASQNSEQATLDTPAVMLFTTDVQKLHLFLSRMQDQCISELSLEPSTDCWSTLAKVCMTQIILFNRCREEEVPSLALSAFLSRYTSVPHDDIGWCLSEVEKILCQNFAKVVISEEIPRPVPILMTPKMLHTLELLIEKRELCGVLKENRYVFAKPLEMSHFSGTDCFHGFAKACGAKSPAALTIPKLRQQVATLSTVLNLTATELEQLAEFLGHDINTHQDYYRPPIKALQLSKIGEVLFALEQGRTAEFYGKNMDEIHIKANERILTTQEGCYEFALDEPSANNQEVMSSTHKRKPPGPEESPAWGGALAEGGPHLFNEPGPSKRRRTTWTEQEVKAVETQMMAFITSCQVPGAMDCKQCLRAEPNALKNRDWKSIKYYVYNRIKALRRPL